MSEPIHINGIVMCGGKSTRMGRDKGLLPAEELTWAGTAAQLLASLQIPVAVSINPAQQTAYSKIFSEAQLVIDDRELDLHGPLHGILSCHRKYPQQHLLVLACDLPFMTDAILQTLLSQQQEDPGYEAYVYLNQNEAEPLCALYTAEGLQKIILLYRQQQLAKHSVKYALEQLRVCYIPVRDEQRRYFRNINEHASFGKGSEQ